MGLNIYLLISVIIILITGFVFVVRHLVRQNHQLEMACEHWEKLATIDPLTGAKSRLLLMDHLEREMRYVQRTKDEESSLVLYIDLNDFKQINDQDGHTELHGQWRR